MSARAWNYLIVAAGCWMLGEGARMVVMGLFHKDHWYNPNLFDIFFDWLPMAVIGTAFLVLGIRDFYRMQCEKQGRGPRPCRHQGCASTGSGNEVRGQGIGRT